MPLIRNDTPIVEGTKQMFVELIEKFKSLHRMNQRQLAERLSVDESIVSKVLSGDLEKFSMERLMKYTSELYPGLVVNVAAKEKETRKP